MNIVWGILMVLIGLFLFISALKRSEFIVYRLLHARSRLLWGEHAHTFLLVVGLVLMGLSSLFFLNVW
ncbi:MAG: hypothetical protein JEY71_17825 [Sphaerochaeta sp.]|nr:hypothetical protein [Sphaerochaeta sp.]MBL7006648.1 hypothetical protein [Spirochaetia bacterium]